LCDTFAAFVVPCRQFHPPLEAGAAADGPTVASDHRVLFAAANAIGKYRQQF
jgi:hypothetical protein